MKIVDVRGVELSLRPQGLDVLLDVAKLLSQQVLVENVKVGKRLSVFVLRLVLLFKELLPQLLVLLTLLVDLALELLNALDDGV